MAEAEIPLFGEEPVVNEQNDNIAFASAGDVVSNDYYQNTIQNAIVDAITGDKEHNLHDFLRRPVKMHSGEWSGESPKSWIVDKWLGMPEWQRCREKLKGFYGFTATLNFKFVFNAQPFEQGLAMVSWMPLASADDPMFKTFFVSGPSTSSVDLTALSTLPHVTMNLAQTSEMTLSVPHLSPTCVISLLQSQPTVGILYFSSVIAPSSALSTTKIPYSVYFYLTDVTTFGATHVTAQGIHETIIPVSGAMVEVEPQGDESEQAEADSTNLVSKIGTTARKVQTFGTDLLKTPILGDALTPFARPVLNAADSFLKIFGFSRPSDIRMTNVNHQILGHTALCDAPSFASKMSVVHNQKVSPIAMGLVKEDELSISYLAQKKAIVDRVDWKVGASPSFVRSWTVNPNVYRTQEWKNRSFYHPSPVRFVSEMFAMWRGSLIFTFQVVCTNFHSGRIRLLYDTDDSDVGESDRSASYSQIIDIRGPQTFHIVCPFLSVTPWRNVPQYGVVNDTSRKGFFLCESQLPNASHGYGLDREMKLSLHIETPFRAPDTVSQEIDMVVWVSGGKDFEVSHPITCMHPSVIGDFSELPADLEPPTNPSMIVDTGPPVALPKVVPQGAEDEGETYTFGSPGTTSTAYASTVGEVVRSLRTLIKRPQLQGSIDQDAGFQDNAMMLIPPWNFGTNVHAYSQNTSESPLFGDPMHKIFHAYRFYQGGMRVIVRPRDYYTSGVITTISKASNMLVDVTSSFNWANDLCVIHLEKAKSDTSTHGFADASVFFSSIVNGATEVEVPFYSRFPFCSTSAEHTSFATNFIKDIINGAHPDIFLLLKPDMPSVGSKIQLYRSAADDFSLGYFMFAPLSMANANYRSTFWGVKKPPVFPTAASAQQTQAGAIPLSSQDIARAPSVQAMENRMQQNQVKHQNLINQIRDAMRTPTPSPGQKENQNTKP